MRRILLLLVVVGAFVALLSYVRQPEEARAARMGAVTGAELATPQAPVKFDGEKAWEHLKQQVAIGPRPAGSPALRQTRAYITRQISAMGLTVQEQPFTASTPNGKIEMVNLIVRLPGKRPDRILFVGHYDTKYFRDEVFVGASDGASSGAWLIEWIRAVKDRPREFTYEIVWLDGEEAVCRNWDDCSKPGAPDNTYGSRHYVQAAKAANAIPSLKALILVDMIADRDLAFLREQNSTPWLKDIIWGAARRLGHGGVFQDREIPIEDDHMPFVEAGVAAVDIIDLDYPAWHMEGDTLDAVSARSLQVVGDVVLAALPKVEARVRSR
jgi:Peptidase family M28